MKNKRIRRNDRVWFNDNGCKRQGLVEHIDGDYMSIILDGFGGKVSMSARKKSGKWYAYRSYDDYVLEIFKM